MRRDQAPAIPPLPPHDLIVTDQAGSLLALSVITTHGITGAPIVIDCDSKRVASVGQNSDGMRAGRWETRDPHGMPTWRETLVAGRRDGLCEYWDEEGRPIAATTGI